MSRMRRKPRDKNNEEAVASQTASRHPFFTGTAQGAVQRKQDTAFFQASLNVGPANDKYEKEADAVAGAVANKNGGTPVVQQKKVSSIQRLSTPMEEEKLGTNDARMRKDKEIQEKREIQRSDMPGKEEEEEKGMMQKKEDGSGGHASSSLSTRIENSSGSGKTMPAAALKEMNTSFGKDFSNVNIHADAQAAQMNKELGAQAFTHGTDIYFNNGKYNTETSTGKKLLAHELTHVIQQTATADETIQPMLTCPAHLSGQDPVPAGWKPYHGASSVFHCGYRGILEDRVPTPSDPQNECFYDETGALVDASHPYAGCRGTPNSYDSEQNPVKHTLIDPGGIVRSGPGAFLTSRYKQVRGLMTRARQWLGF